MSTTHAPESHAAEHEDVDPVENIVHAMPIVLPVMGGLLMFLLAFIAIYVG